MKVKEKYSLKDKVILETTLKIMFERNFESVNIKTVSEYVMMTFKSVKELYATDDRLRMAAMEYAAVVWVNQLRYDLKNVKGKCDKMKKLIRNFIAGSETHPDSLSLYIDVWKCLRDSKKEDNEIMRNTLNTIYKYYVDVFKEVVSDELCIESEDIDKLDQLAWIMVVISDGFHIQSLIQNTPMDFDAITDELYQMVDSKLLKGKANYEKNIIVLS